MARPWSARCYGGSSPTRGVAPKQHRGLRRAFSPAFFGTGSLDPLGRVGADEAGAAKDGFGGCDAARPARAGWNYDLLISGPRVNPIYPPSRARAREGADGPAAGCPL